MANTKARGKSRGQSTAGIPLATPTIPARPVAATEPVSEPDEIMPEPAEAELEQERTGAPLWLQLTSLVLAVLGLILSAYETYAHYTTNHLYGCSTNPHALFDCGAVITSSQSMVFNVFPVAVLGLAFYVVVVALMTPWAWRMRRPEVAWLRMAAMITGMGFVMYLIYVELYQLQEVCEYCSAVHIVTFLLFCITVISAAVWGMKPSQK
jgi:uncharacterized membrane protein